MRHSLNLFRLEQNLRRELCGHCPDCAPEPEGAEAGGARLCESDCELFQELPALLAGIERLDPMLANYGTAVKDLIERRSGRGHDVDSPLYRHRRRIARIVQDALREPGVVQWH